MTRETAVLGVRDAYRLWAPVYDVENALTALENEAVLSASPPVRDRALLDAACGTGRRLPDAAAGARVAVGVDLAPEMLAHARAPLLAQPHAPLLAAGDLCALPVSTGTFDLVWCRLALGHVRDIDVAYGELARVALAGATLIVTDFHPAAAAAGHTRTFRDAAGTLHAVEHHMHTPAAHCAAAAAAGWRLVQLQDVPVSPAIRSYYVQAGALGRYAAQLGMPLVLLLLFDRQ